MLRKDVKSYNISESNSRPLIIWGAGVYGEMVYKVLTELNRIKPIAIIDNKVLSVPWAKGVPVQSSKFLSDYKDCDVIVCAAKSYEIIVEQLSHMSDLVAYNCSNILRKYKKCIEENKIEKNSYYIYGDFAIDEVIDCYDYYMGVDNGYSDKVYLDYCVLCITSCCTLKCKNCAAFITKYNNPKNYDINYVSRIFGTFLQAMDGIRELELMGGEPFINPEFAEILKWCIEHPKIHSIKIITNGTILPDERILDLLADNKVKLVIDDYGEKSWKIKELIEACNNNNIRTEIQELQTWYKLEPFVNKNYNEDTKRSIFRGCAFRHCVGITNSRLYHCNVAGHANTVGLISDQDSQFVEIENYFDSIDELRERIREFMKLDYLYACSYCDYSSHIHVEVGEQLN